MARPTYSDDTLLARWLSGELSAAEEEALRERPEMADYERLLGNMERMQPPAYDTAGEFAKLTAARTASENKKLHPRPRPASGRSVAMRRIWYAAAASVALLLTAWLLWPEPNLHFAVGNGGQTLAAALPDGSTARLNAGSILDFAPDAEQRLATLAGEAYFEVEKSDVPFVVKTPLGTVTVVGTSFNVYSRDGQMDVSCTTGKVRVKFNGAAEAYPLTPGESVSIDAAGAVSTGANNSENLDWLENRSVFINRPLAEILAEFERQFDLTVSRPAGLDLEEKFNVTFPNDNVDLALPNVFDPLKDFVYERDGRQIILRPVQ